MQRPQLSPLLSSLALTYSSHPPNNRRFVHTDSYDQLSLRTCCGRRTGGRISGACCFCRQAPVKPLPLPGHSSVLQALGTFILWMGWYGFNAGSTLAIDGAATATAARIFATTTISASFGGITAVILERWRGAGKQWDVASMCNGVLVGLVSISSGCATCPAWSAVLIGMFGGKHTHHTRESLPRLSLKSGRSQQQHLLTLAPPSPIP